MSLQLPGLGYGTGEPTTVEIDFLNNADSPLYTIKGEVFVQTLPMQADSLFIPDKLTGTQKYVRKIRIKAGESGMTLKLFDSPTASVPKLLVIMKAGFLMENNKSIDIDVMGGDEHQSIRQAEINWYNRDLESMKRLNGFHVGKIELHVERKINDIQQPVFKFGMISTPQSSVLMPEVKGVSLLPQNSVFNPPPPSSSPNIYLNMPQPQAASPPSQQYPVQQYPNAPPFVTT